MLSTAEALALCKSVDLSLAKKNLSDYLKNADIPRDERAKVWAKTPDELMTIYRCVWNPSNYEAAHDEISWYDEGFERYSTVDLREACGRLFNVTKEEDKLKEALFIDDCLEAGIHGFSYDW